ncbi:MAG: TAXI family TRAP transporter solute-binding subunit, partial [Xanthobacteraceae bacterium]
LRGASIGIGPKESGTAYLIRQLFDDQDLRQLDVHFSYHELPEQAELVAQGKLDLAAFVMEEDAEFLHTIMRQESLDIVTPDDLKGLIARYPWLSLGTIAAGRYDLVRPIPAENKSVARLATLVVAGPCARRADRIALLVLLAAELPGFVRSNPPSATSSATDVPLAPESNQFFQNGQPALADQYFPWLVNILSPAYWVYLVMAITVLFNGMSAYSRFRLWRLDAAREKLEALLKQFVDAGVQMREVSANRPIDAPHQRATAETLFQQFLDLRIRCQRYTGSFVTPMGDEMYYRYQQSLIDEAITTLGSLLRNTRGKANPKPN